MRVDTKELVATVGYLLGMKKEVLLSHYDEDCHNLLEKLFADKEATIVRCLCKLRTAIWLNFKRTDDVMRIEMRNLNLMEWIDQEDIKKLSGYGIQIIKANYRAEKYIADLTGLINDRINNCEKLFYDWQRFDYIRDLFAIPKYTQTNIMKKEYSTFMDNLNDYPFQMYMHWTPTTCGNILQSDRVFLQMLFSQHGDSFTDTSKYKDANAETKRSIYDFIAESNKTAIAVDCENSDAFKFVGVLRNLNQEELAKIEKITLYDDAHTSSAWDHLEKVTSIPVEHIEVERVMDQKSLVDVKMTAGVCCDYYAKNIDSFILLSSDSDFWALISSLPSANFLVMYEYSKCSPAMKTMLERYEYYCCSIDDFYSGNTEAFKKDVLFTALYDRLPDLSGLNAKDLVKQIHSDTFVPATEKELRNFFNRYMKNLRLKIEDDGSMRFVIVD